MREYSWEAFQHKHFAVSCLTSDSAGSYLVPLDPENNSGFSQKASRCRHTSHDSYEAPPLNKSDQTYSEDLPTMHQAGVECVLAG